METISQKIYTTAGKDAGSVELPGAIWGLPWNADLVHQVVIGMQSNTRTGLADTKTRGEVAGGGKKPWRQKGTGRARHGSTRSPIWKGGGVSHGPLAEKNYDKKINKKMRAKALFVTLSQKLRDGKVLFVDSLGLNAIKTKDAASALQGLAIVSGFETLNTQKENNVFVIVPKKDDVAAKSFRNIFHVTVEEVRNLNPVDVMNYRYIVVADPKTSNEFLSGKVSDKKSADKAEKAKPAKVKKAAAPKKEKAPKAKKVAKKVTAKAE